jgi:hypothetical protein
MKFPSGSNSTTSGTVVAGNGVPGSAANQLNNPTSVVVDCHGILYIADAGKTKVKKNKEYTSGKSRSFFFLY